VNALVRRRGNLETFWLDEDTQAEAIAMAVGSWRVGGVAVSLLSFALKGTHSRCSRVRPQQSLQLQCTRSRPWLKFHTAILEFWTGILNRKQRIMWNHVEEHCKAFEQRRFALIGAPSHASPFVPCPRLHVSATELSTRRRCTWHAHPQVRPECVPTNLHVHRTAHHDLRHHLHYEDSRHLLA
jgi:hypothetical protein